MDAEGVAAEHGDVIAFAGVDDAVILRGHAVGFGQSGEAWGEGFAEDIREALVFLHDDEDVVVMRDGRARIGRGAQREEERGQRQE